MSSTLQTAHSLSRLLSPILTAPEPDLTITVADDVGNATVPQSVTVSHGGLADLASLEVMVNGQTYSSGNLPVPAAGLSNAALALIGVTSDNIRFNGRGHRLSLRRRIDRRSAQSRHGHR